MQPQTSILESVKRNINILNSAKKNYAKYKNKNKPFTIRESTKYVNDETFNFYCECLSGKYLKSETACIHSFLIQLQIYVDIKNYDNVTSLLENNNVSKNSIYFYSVIFTIAPLRKNFVTNVVLKLLDKSKKYIREISLTTSNDNLLNQNLCVRHCLSYYTLDLIYTEHRPEKYYGTIFNIIDSIYDNTGFYNKIIIETWNVPEIIKFAVHARYNDHAMMCEYLFEKNTVLTKTQILSISDICSNETIYQLILTANLKNKLDLFVKNIYVNFLKTILINAKICSKKTNKHNFDVCCNIFKDVIYRSHYGRGNPDYICVDDYISVINNQVFWYQEDIKGGNFSMINKLEPDGDYHFILSHQRKILCIKFNRKNIFVKNLHKYHKDVMFEF